MTAVGFDFDHTLGVDNGLEFKALIAYARELGRPISPDQPEWHRTTGDLLAAFRADELTMDDMLARFGDQLGAANIRTDRWRDICYGLVPHLVEPIPGARELIATLRARNVPTAILTNGWSPLQQKKIAHALGPDALAMPILVSDALHAVKPAPAAFDALVDALGTSRDNIWYVGDNALGDVGGALAAGLRAVWFNWESQSYPQDLPPPTRTIAALRELDQTAENTPFP